MSRFLRLSIPAAAILLIIACSIGAANNGGTNGLLADASPVKLVVQAVPSTFTAAGQVIGYTYTVTNTGTAALAGPVTITDDKASVQCPDLKTIGNKDANLDPNESVICAAGYSVAAADVSAGAVTSNARARVGGIDSAIVTTSVPMAENKVLTVSVAANPTSYSQLGQNIEYTYTITNTGAATIGPAQFVIRDDRFPNPLNCGPATTTLATNQTVQCKQTYTIAAADLTVNQITSTVRASAPGVGTIQPATITINFSGVPTGATPSSSGTIPRGSTVKHSVEKGEWMWQITRCYGADFDAVRLANPQVIDPDIIEIGETITVPNAGSVSTIFGKPCIKSYTVKSGDTWQSIANDPSNNAAVDVLMAANQDTTLTPGKIIVIPLNSKFYQTSTSPTPIKQPIRLNFSANSPKVTLQGSIGTPETIRHVFTGVAGQILTIKLTVPTNDVGFAVFGPNNATLKALDTNNSWSGTLPANGDYFIDLISGTLGAATKTYTLDVTLTTPASASPFTRVADINPGAGDSSPSYLSEFNGQLYFAANANDNFGNELWRYDQGLNAVSRVSDMNPGTGSSDPAFLTQFGNMLYFRANGNDNGGTELWRYNGSATGRVTDINSGPADANPMYLTVFNGNLYFSAKGSDNMGTELWRFDGNTSTRVTDINPGSGDSNPAYLAVYNNALYFSATSNDGKGTELWKYDGSTASLIADINNGIGSSSPAFLTVFNGVLYFSANGNDNTGTELWKFDGTNYARAADINPGPPDSIPTYLTVFGNALYFSANADAAGFEIWKFDGTSATRVSDLNTAGNSNPAYLTVFKNELYFQANANDGTGAELWKYKGP